MGGRIVFHHAIVDEYCSSEQRSLSIDTKKLQRIRINTILNEWIEKYGVAIEPNKITGLNKNVITKWVEDFSRTRKPSSVNNYIAFLRSFLRWCYINNYIQDTCYDECYAELLYHSGEKEVQQRKNKDIIDARMIDATKNKLHNGKDLPEDSRELTKSGKWEYTIVKDYYYTESRSTWRSPATIKGKMSMLNLVLYQWEHDYGIVVTEYEIVGLNQKILLDWLNTLKTRYSVNVVKNYISTTKRFLEWYENSWADPDGLAELLQEYISESRR